MLKQLQDNVYHRRLPQYHLFEKVKFNIIINDTKTDQVFDFTAPGCSTIEDLLHYVYHEELKNNDNNNSDNKNKMISPHCPLTVAL